jgi:hypothetical protein
VEYSLIDPCEPEILHVTVNKCSGSLPDIFDKLPNLVEAYLVDNQFTGSVPSTLTKCTGLSKYYHCFVAFHVWFRIRRF